MDPKDPQYEHLFQYRRSCRWAWTGCCVSIGGTAGS